MFHCTRCDHSCVRAHVSEAALDLIPRWRRHVAAAILCGVVVRLGYRAGAARATRPAQLTYCGSSTDRDMRRGDFNLQGGALG